MLPGYVTIIDGNNRKYRNPILALEFFLNLYFVKVENVAEVHYNRVRLI